MTIALVLGGGAPNLTLMAGAVAALDDAGVEFDVVSTSGAGMLIGLLYAAPKGRRGDIKRDRAAALKNTVNMGVDDAIYRFRSLYDAWVKSIIVPLTAIAEDDIKASPPPATASSSAATRSTSSSFSRRTEGTFGRGQSVHVLLSGRRDWRYASAPRMCSSRS